MRISIAVDAVGELALPQAGVSQIKAVMSAIPGEHDQATRGATTHCVRQGGPTRSLDITDKTLTLSRQGGSNFMWSVCGIKALSASAPVAHYAGDRSDVRAAAGGARG